MPSVYSDLRKKIKGRKAKVAVVGLGYVGLPMAVEFAKKGFSVSGLDSSSKRVNRLKKGISYIEDTSAAEIKAVIKKGRLSVTTDERCLDAADVIIVCVPTPLSEDLKPDISYIRRATKTLKKHLRRGQLIVLESTTYPGTTREVVSPVLQKKGLCLGEDFYLAFSPERIDPGNPKYSFSNIPKLVGAFTNNGTELARMLYSMVVDKVVGLSSPETAEVTKLLENTFRIVNIGLINEFAQLCHVFKIDVWEVIEAAKTKPFGFMPFYPGPGVGGHCIPADPIYLSWKARKMGFRTKMIDLAAKVNRRAPELVVKRAVELLDGKNKKIKGARVLLLGVSYKKDVNDLRESPALDIIKLLMENKARWSYHDPHIPYLDVHGIKAKPVKLTRAFLKEQDLVMLVTGHSCFDYGMLARNSALIFDTRNAFGSRGIKGDNIFKL